MTRAPKPRRAAQHPVQPDPDDPGPGLAAFGKDEPTARSTPKAIAEERQRAATAPGEPPVATLASEAYHAAAHRAAVEQTATQHLNPVALAALRADCIQGDQPKPRGRR